MTAKIKLAACLDAAEFDNFVLNRHVDNGPFSRVSHFLDGILPELGLTLEDRAFCESDPTKLQLLPYCVIHNEDGDVLTYDRPVTGDEANLYYFSSIGFGGHMDTLVPEVEGSDNEGLEIRSVIDNAARELEEEVPFTGSPDDFREHVITELESSLLISDNATLIRKLEGVDKFHLGLVIPIFMHSSMVSLNKDNSEAANLRWLSREELKGVNLESWSKSYLDYNLAYGELITDVRAADDTDE